MLAVSTASLCAKRAEVLQMIASNDAIPLNEFGNYSWQAPKVQSSVLYWQHPQQGFLAFQTEIDNALVS